MVEERFRKYEPFFGKWYARRLLGEGSFGKVYEIAWDDGAGGQVRSALKLMHIPTRNAWEIQREAQPDLEAVRRYFAGQVERIREEIRILQKCKGHSNIVSYEDHLIVEAPGEEGVGWDILIRMELLRPLAEHFASPLATQFDVIRMWLHITNALVYCEQQGIMHRDIKPANILVSESGMYKLSDFGAARADSQGDASTRVGTDVYMAPEVYQGQRYDRRADYYSLGRVVYFYLNHNRHAFLPPYPREVDHDAYERAESKRISGREKIPPVPQVPGAVNRVLLRCLAVRPQKRYRDAAELHRAIRKLLRTKERELRSRPLGALPAHGKGRLGQEGDRGEREKRGFPAIWVGVASMLLVGGMAGVLIGGQMRHVELRAEERPVRAVQEPVVQGPAIQQQIVQEQTEKERVIQEPTQREEERGSAVEPDMADREGEQSNHEEVEEEIIEEIVEETTEVSFLETASEEDSESAQSARSTNYYTLLESPLNGTEVDSDIIVLGDLLADKQAEQLDIYADILREDAVVDSFPVPCIGKKEGSALERIKEKYASAIDTAEVYELLGRGDISALPEGAYSLALYGKDIATGEGVMITSIPFSVDRERTVSLAELQALTASSEEDVIQVEGSRYISPDRTFAVGLDLDESKVITGCAEQIILSGWLDASAGTGISTYIQIDDDPDQTYDSDRAAELGGSIEMERAPRRLESTEGETVSGGPRNEEEAGLLISMRLPFLQAGTHKLRLTFSIALPDTELVTLDMSLTLTVDASIPVSEGEIERIKTEWLQIS